jgi:hypothetical protein
MKANFFSLDLHLLFDYAKSKFFANIKTGILKLWITIKLEYYISINYNELLKWET